MNQEHTQPARSGLKPVVGDFFAKTPFLAMILAALAAVCLELAVGDPVSDALGLRKEPPLFGVTVIFKVLAKALDAAQGDGSWSSVKWVRIPGAVAYTLAIYAAPMWLVMWALRGACNAVARTLMDTSLMLSVVVHLGLLYLVFHLWTDVSDYRLVTLKLMMVAVLLTLSINLINGYMGEFSCSHPGFMALGAYVASIFTVGLFVDDRLFGDAVFHGVIAPLFFPVGLFLGGCVAALAALIVAIPSFRTRGDYLAIISLAFMFIVKSFLENLEFAGGPRGLSSQPDWATLPVVFLVMAAGVWIMNNFVTSTMGKALNAVRDNESAAEAMTVDTRKTKMTCFMFGAFWAGVAGGLFAHVLRYVAPATFGLSKLAEILAMVYFGGLNSVWGSITGAVSISLLSEALRPLEILKWICIPLLLILVMIYRPRGVLAFKEFNMRTLLSPRSATTKGGTDAAA